MDCHPFSLHSLSQAQRDHFLGEMSLVDRPLKFIFNYESSRCVFNRFEGNLINYSRFHDEVPLSVRDRVPDISKMRTGDVVVTTDDEDDDAPYIHFVVWLNKDVEPHPASTPCDPELIESELINFEVTRESYFNEETTSEEQPDYHPIPTLLPREAPGWHDDGQHHCYLFPQHDDKNQMVSCILGSAPRTYYGGRYKSLMLDPMLIHSQSDIGLNVLPLVRAIPAHEVLEYYRKHYNPEATSLSGVFPDNYIASAHGINNPRHRIYPPSFFSWKPETQGRYFTTWYTDMDDARAAFTKHCELQLGMDGLK